MESAESSRSGPAADEPEIDRSAAPGNHISGGEVSASPETDALGSLIALATGSADFALLPNSETPPDPSSSWVAEVSIATTTDGHVILRLAGGDPDAPSGGPDPGYGIRVSSLFELAASGNSIRICVVARAVDAAPSARFAIAYSTNDVGNSGWRWFSVGPDWGVVEIDYTVPPMRHATGDFIGILPDKLGAVGVEVAAIAARVTPIRSGTPLAIDSYDRLVSCFGDGRIDGAFLEYFPIPLHSMPIGWLALTDMQILYTISKHAPGPILEIGSWLGRSTAAIAAGIRDSFDSTKLFDTVDFGITSREEWNSKSFGDFQGYYRNDMISRSIYQIGGSTAVLIENLRRVELLPYVTSIIRGDSTKVPLRTGYGVIFCDTLHNEDEVRRYGSYLNNLLQTGGWLVSDDIVDENLGKILQQYIDGDLCCYSKLFDPSCKFCIIRKKREAH